LGQLDLEAKSSRASVLICVLDCPSSHLSPYSTDTLLFQMYLHYIEIHLLTCVHGLFFEAGTDATWTILFKKPLCFVIFQAKYSVVLCLHDYSFICDKDRFRRSI